MASPASAQAKRWNRVQAKPRRLVLARRRCHYAAEFHVLGPVTLTLMAAATTSIRVGTLVTSLYFRHPVTFTKAAMTVDHLSGGRAELALGVGDPRRARRLPGWTGPRGSG
jgi:alkanesulfonate monooxygenase SsuD/methylene tetrahydromethanopterin reductase-like flavin-dependent oxidoreductase (luciferase family)